MFDGRRCLREHSRARHMARAPCAAHVPRTLRVRVAFTTVGVSIRCSRANRRARYDNRRV